MGAGTVLSFATGLSAGASTSGAVRMLAMMLTAGQLMLAALILVSGEGIAAALALVAGAGVVVLSMFATKRYPLRRLWISLIWLIAAITGVILLAGLGGTTVLSSVSSNIWGGLLLTMVISVAGILVSFPLGVALAIGRRSPLPVVRGVCTAYIELVRGVPLITVLFMAQLLVPLVTPNGRRSRTCSGRWWASPCSARPIWPRMCAAVCSRCRRPGRGGAGARAEWRRKSSCW